MYATLMSVSGTDMQVCVFQMLMHNANTQISKSDLEWRDSRLEFSLAATVASSLNGLDDEFLHNRVPLVLRVL